MNITEYKLDAIVLQLIGERLFDKESGVRKEALRICLNNQEACLNESLKIQGVLKDILRHDHVPDIRRMCLEGIIVCKSTLNSVIERCVDSNLAVRRAFWITAFSKINYKDILPEQRIFLMKSAFIERELNAKNIFINFVRNIGFEEFIYNFHCKETCYEEILEMVFMEDEYKLNKYTPEYIHFMYVYYRHIENKDGRDALKLSKLEEFLEILYERCLIIQDKINDEINGENNEKNNDKINDIVDSNIDKINDDIQIAIGLFKLLEFYDIFMDSERKSVLKIINLLLLKCEIKEIVEESIILTKRICNKDITNFIGSIIKKVKNKKICYVICEYVMKHLEFSEMHQAIFQEIVITNINESIGIIFWYVVANPSEYTKEFYLSFLPNKKILEGATDLTLMGILEWSEISEQFITQIEDFNENVVIPITKLLLAGEVVDKKGDENIVGENIVSENMIDKNMIENFCKFRIVDKIFKNLLLIYYSTESACIQQYLSLFFNEYLLNDSTPLINSYCEISQLITANHKIFLDQSLYWIRNSEKKNGSQILFFNISVFIYKNYDEIKNRKHLFQTLEKINVLPCWDLNMTKWIIYILSSIIKMKPRENIQALLAQVIEVDDGSPMQSDQFSWLKGLLEKQ